MSLAIDSIPANWFVCLESIVISAAVSPRCEYFIIILPCHCDTNPQTLVWDCVQQKMGQAVNYHKCFGK